ncbi:MAG: hypothetical protein ACTSP3_00640 [Candidatus Heimdallarchaeaceae archaeon]
MGKKKSEKERKKRNPSCSGSFTKKSEGLQDSPSLVHLLHLQFTLLFERKDQFEEVKKIQKRMKNLSEQANYAEGKALALISEWMIEKLRNNREKAKKARNKAKRIIEQIKNPTSYNYHTILYCYSLGLMEEEGKVEERGDFSQTC